MTGIPVPGAIVPGGGVREGPIPLACQRQFRLQRRPDYHGLLLRTGYFPSEPPERFLSLASVKWLHGVTVTFSQAK